jgi:hypothetical protein
MRLTMLKNHAPQSGKIKPMPHSIIISKCQAINFKRRILSRIAFIVNSMKNPVFIALFGKHRVYRAFYPTPTGGGGSAT